MRQVGAIKILGGVFVVGSFISTPTQASIVSVLYKVINNKVDTTSQEKPENFYQAKKQARNFVYQDRNNSNFGTLYCGCQWRWTTQTGGKPNLASCNYKTQNNAERAEQTEYEHIVPISRLAKNRKCWGKGGRSYCQETDPFFNEMEANLHNISVIIGEVNLDRNNYQFGEIQGKKSMYGQCAAKTDFKKRRFEPRDKAKGLVARTTFYMYDRYNLELPQKYQKLLMSWDKKYPPSKWETERDKRIAKIMGHHNPFVTGDAKWRMSSGQSQSFSSNNQHPTSKNKSLKVIRGNRNSKIYHLPQGCPSYHAVSEKNRIYFKSEQKAQNAGYKKAGNCNY